VKQNGGVKLSYEGTEYQVVCAEWMIHTAIIISNLGSYDPGFRTGAGDR
jgi:hypothetical protein